MKNYTSRWIISIVVVLLGSLITDNLLHAQEIQVRGRDGVLPWVNIDDGDTTPRDADGTDFDSRNTVGGSNTNPFQIRNRDNTTLTISSISISPSTHFTLTNVPTSVPGNSNRQFNITFDPASGGTHFATVTIINNDPDGGEGTFTFRIMGVGIDNSPEIKLQGRDGALPWTEIVDGDTTPRDADGTDFDTHDVFGGSNTNPFRIQNLGGSVLNITSITDNSPHFSVSSVPNNVDPGQNETFNVTFNPTSPGTHFATITILNNDPDGGEGTFTYRVTGVGRDNLQEINVRGRNGSALPWVSIEDGDTTPRDADGTDFDTRDVFGGQNDNTFQIQNSGDQTLSISSISVSNGSNFSIVGTPPTSVAPNSNATFTVRFNPSAIGTQNATVTIRNNDPDGGEDPYTFRVTGVGRDNLQEIKVQGRDGALPWVEILDGDTTPRDADGTDFDGRDVAGGASNDNPFRILNEGDATLTISSITVSNTSHFSIVGATPTSVAPNSNAQFTVRFNPSSIGTHFATVTINNNDPDGGEDIFTFRIVGVGLDNLQEIKIQGRDGILPWVEIVDGDTTPRDADGTDFDDHAVVGGSNTNPFRIVNEGNTSLAINSIKVDPADHFTITNIPTSVPANSNRTFDVTFDPTSAGTHFATITIDNNDPDGGEAIYTYRITGVGIDKIPEIQIRGRDGVLPWVEIEDGDTTPRDADGTDFDSHNVIGGSNTNPFQIRNLGDATLNITDFSISPSIHFNITQAPDGSIEAGQTTTFEVTFDPSSPGRHDAEVTIKNDDPTGDEESYNFTITGVGIANEPEIEVQGRDGILPWVEIIDGDTTPRDADGTDFDGQPVFGGSNTNPFRIRNVGDAPLSISSITVDGPHFAIVGPVPTSVAEGSNETFEVRYNPTTIGTHTATVTINNNDPDGGENVFTFAVIGKGIDNLQEIKVQGRDGTLPWTEIVDGDTTPRDADGTDFDRHNVLGGSNTNPFRIQNLGDVTLTISSISVSDEDNYSIVGAIPTSVAPGSSETFDVRFNPASIGRHNATITINNNDPDGGEDVFTYRITGVGLDNLQEINVRGRDGILPWVAITDGDTTPRDADGTDFDSHNVSGGSNTNPFQIRNEGDGILTISSISVSPATHFSISNIPTSVAGNDQETFDVTFNPSSAGTHNATITIINNDPDGGESTFTYRITGVGIENQPEIRVQGRDGILPWVEISDGADTPRDADGTDFDRRDVLNGSNTNPFRIHNDGDATLTINSITVSPNTDFTITNVPNSVAPGGRETFDIVFDPTSAGIKNAVVTISNNDPSGGEGDFTFAITGVGLADEAEIQVQGRDGILPWIAIDDGDTTPRDADGTDFDTRAEVGGANTNPFRIRNNGNSPLNISSITVSPNTDYVVTDIPTSVAAGSSEIFRITFNPSSVGTKNATVTILNDDPTTSQQTFTYAITGIGESSNIPDTDGDGVNDNLDVCPGFDDNIDTDADGIPDGCDTEEPVINCEESVLITTTLTGDQTLQASGQIELRATVQTGANITLDAPDIIIGPNSTVETGAQLNLIMEGCDPNAN